MLYAFTLVAAMTTTLVYLIYRWALPKPLPNIPFSAAAATSPLGDLPQMISYIKRHGRIRPWFESRNEVIGAPLVQIWPTPFAKPCLVISDFYEAQDILMRRSKEFDRASRTIEAFSCVVPNHQIALKTSDPRFRGNRDFVKDLMSPTFLREVNSGQIYQKITHLIRLWSVKCDLAGASPFDAQQDLFDAAMDMICAAAFALDDNLSTLKRKVDTLSGASPAATVLHASGLVQFPLPLAVETIEPLRMIAQYLGRQVNQPLPRLSHLFNMLTDTDLRRNFALKDQFLIDQIESSIKKVLIEKSPPSSAVDFIVQRESVAAAKHGRQPDFFSHPIKDQLFGYIIAGQETSATMLCWTVKFLSDYPRVQTELRSNLKLSFIVASTESRQPTAIEIADTRVQYLEAVISESLRLCPPIPMHIREAICDTILLGQHVPKGTNIMLNVNGPSFKRPPLQMESNVQVKANFRSRREQWETDDIGEFRPERWLKVDGQGNVKYDPQAGPSMSFSLGPRACFGRRLAYLEMRMLLTLIVWNFEFQRLDNKLSHYDTAEAITSRPIACFVALRHASQPI